MKKYIFCIFLCFGLILAGCGDKETPKEAADNHVELANQGEKVSSSWQWGPEVQLDFAQTDDGRVIVENPQGEEILDVSNYPQTDILFDQETGACRCIKTYTRDGAKKIQGDDDSEYELYLYKYDYYDTTGKVLEEDSSDNCGAIKGNLGFSLYEGEERRLKNLATGEILTSANSLEGYLSDKGVVTVNPTDQASGFWSDEGEELGSINKAVVAVPSTNAIWQYTSTDTWAFYSNKTVTNGFAPAVEGDIPPDNDNLSELERQIQYADLPEFSYFCYQDGSDEEEPKGLVDSQGNIVIEPSDTHGFFPQENGDIGVAKETTTEILDGETLKPVKTLDFPVIYCDGENAVKQTQVYYNYLTDGEGKVLSECYQELLPVATLGAEERYFIGKQWNSWYRDILDTKGNVLFTDELEGSPIYLGNGDFYMSSVAGTYVVDSTGKVTEVLDLSEGYQYNEKEGTITEK